MTVYVALLRGINVGGKNSLPMQDLRDILTSLDCEQVKTYIQSGNAVFRSNAGRVPLGKMLEAAVAEQFGFTPKVLLLMLADYQKILSANPFPDAVESPRSLHISFLSEKPANPDLTLLDTLRSPTENYVLLKTAFYLHAPDGIGQSKLAAKVEKSLGVQTTSRNWRTASMLADLAAAISE